MLVDSTPIVGITIVPVTIHKILKNSCQQGDKLNVLRVLLTSVFKVWIKEHLVNAFN